MKSECCSGCSSCLNLYISKDTDIVFTMKTVKVHVGTSITLISIQNIQTCAEYKLLLAR